MIKSTPVGKNAQVQFASSSLTPILDSQFAGIHGIPVCRDSWKDK